MSVLLAGGIRVGQLSLMLSETKVYLGGPDLEPIPEEKIEELNKQSKELGITPPGFTA